MRKNEIEQINLLKALESGDFPAVLHVAQHTPRLLEQLGNQMFPLATEFCSSGGDHGKVVQLLFKMFPKFNPNEPDEISKLTPLDLAIRHDNLEMVKLLCEDVKVNPNAKTVRGSALHYAAYLGLINIVKYLCENAKVDPTVLDEDGQTALHYAAESVYKYDPLEGEGPQFKVVKYLSQLRGVKINGRDNKGRTPLNLAVSSSRQDVKEYLLEQIIEKAKRGAALEEL